MSDLKTAVPDAELSACGLDELQGQFDIVINGTSTGLSGNDLPLPAGLLAGSELVYDMVYGKGLTPFLARGQAERADGDVRRGDAPGPADGQDQVLPAARVAVVIQPELLVDRVVDEGRRRRSGG